MRWATVVFACALAADAAAQSVKVKIDWAQLSPPTKTIITAQVVANPPLLPYSAIHDAAWQSLSRLKAERMRLALWYPYPGMAVAELAAPTNTTNWDFTNIDPIVKDFSRQTRDARASLR